MGEPKYSCVFDSACSAMGSEVALLDGEHLEFAGVRCEVGGDDVTCRHLDSGHSIRVSPDGYTLH